MKVLVTGSAGMLGNTISTEFSKTNSFEVIQCSRSQVDLTSTSDTHDFFAKHSPDVVIHCASKVFGIGGNTAFPYDSWRVNNLININVIDASVSSGVSHFVAVGTGAVYPHSLGDIALKEENVWDGEPHDSELGYAVAKRSMISGLQVAKKQHGMDYTYIISCTLVGPFDNFSIEHGHVTPTLIHKFFLAEKSGDQVEIWGDGSSIRDFLYSIDFANAVKLIVSSGPQGLINFGSGSPIPISNIVSSISNCFPGVKYAYNTDKPNGARCRYYCLDKLKNIGFRPSYTIDQAISETVSWFKHTYPNVRGLS